MLSPSNAELKVGRQQDTPQFNTVQTSIRDELPAGTANKHTVHSSSAFSLKKQLQILCLKM